MQKLITKGLIISLLTLIISALALPVMAEQKPQDKIAVQPQDELLFSSNVAVIIPYLINDLSTELLSSNLAENSNIWQSQQNTIISPNMIERYNEWQTNNAVVHIQKIEFNHTLKGSAQYNYGRFSAETGFLSDHSANATSSILYLQSALVVLHYNDFNLAVAARLDEQKKNNFNLNNSDYIAPIYTSSLGFIGSYTINKKWRVTGAITATSVSNNFASSQLVEQNQQNQAMIGTTYSF